MILTATDIKPASDRLAAYGVFAAMLAAAGLPIYLHAPKFYADSYGVGLATLGSVLFALRLVDFVQDPLLARLADITRGQRAAGVGLAAAVMAAALFGLLAIHPPVHPLLWFAVMMTAVFSAYSFLTICFYAQGVTRAENLGDGGHLRLARWRETGALLGVCAAAVAPGVLASWLDYPFAGFAVAFAFLAAAATILMRGEWQTGHVAASAGFGAVLSDVQTRRLLGVAFLNAAPVAVSSTLFLFYVESRLDAAGAEGALLALFFVSAAAAAPVWGRLAESYGARRVLVRAMILSILAFAGALFLGPGDVWLFAFVCLVSGATLGADLTLLPAMFARRMATISPSAVEGFGLWSFMSKATLAFAAIAVFPVLDASGFTSGGENTDAALIVLTLMYAGVPCILKIAAFWLLAATDLTED